MTPSVKESGPERGKPQPISEELLLKTAKEIAVKFIEVGRLTPATFDQVFKEIHATIKESARFE